jgi:ATPase subunit of ABC transporter with duplicated ATPase domains
MIAIHLDKVTVTYIAHPIFTDLSWAVHDDRCVGLVGPNGSGKSTLLRLLAGQLTSDTGFVNRQSGLTVGYLPQEPQLQPAATIWEEALTASSALQKVEAQLAAVEANLADPAVYSDEHKLTVVLD